MANEVAWIKLTTDMFDNRKIKHLRRLPDGNNIVLIWVMLLTMAGRCNSGGMIFLTENIPYTPKMLADELDFEENTVQLALTALEQLNMIVTNQGFFAIAGWEEHQNIDGLEKIREQNRIRKQKQRANQKLLSDVSRDSHGTVTQCHAIDKDKEEDKEKDVLSKDNTRKKPTKHKHGEFQNVLLTDSEFEKLADDFGSDLRDKAITFLDAYIEEKGYKSRSHNLAIKRWVIDAVTKNNQSGKKGNGRKEIVPNWCSEEYEEMVQNHRPVYKKKPKTAAEDEGVRARAEALQKELANK